MDEVEYAVYQLELWLELLEKIYAGDLTSMFRCCVQTRAAMSA